MSFKPKLLVFPTSRSIREYIGLYESDTLLPTLVTIDEFFSKTIKVDKLTYLDEDQRFLYLKEAIQIKNFNKLGLSSEFSQFLKQSEYIFRFFGELAHEMVDIQSLKEADTYEYYSEHLDILEHIYKNYVKLLEDNFCVDKITIKEHYEINNAYLNQFENIEFYFEGYFTKFEFKIISEVAQSNDLMINLSTNEYNKKSWELLQNSGIKLKEDKKYCLDITNKVILSEEDNIRNTPDINIVGFNTRVNQIAYIKTSIITMIQQGCEPKNIVLVLPDESFKDLLELFDAEGYFNYAMGKNIYNSKLYKSLSAINLYLNEDEIKHLELLNFLELDTMFITKTLNASWEKQITIDIFEQTVNYIKTYETNNEILEKFDEEIYKLKRLFFTTTQNISLKDAYKILLQRVGSISLDDVNGGAITVMGLLETRGVTFEGVIIVDFNEGIIPKRSIKDKFLSTGVKKYANLPTIKDRENLQRYYYEKLISQSSYVCISYTHNETSQISRFAHELFVNHSFTNEVSDEKYEHILYKKYKLSHFDKDVILDIDLSELTWSATSLKNYMQCKRMFYFKNIIRLQEHHFSLKPQGFELGSLIHKILEEFYMGNEGKGLGENPNEKLAFLFNQQKNDNPFLMLDLEIWKRKLLKFIENEKRRFESGIQIVALEKPFSFDYKGVKLKGVIDRIDKTKKGYEIIDYKTSSSLKVDTLKTYDKTVDFQLEFYFLALKELLIQEEKEIGLLEPFYYDLNNSTLLKEVMLEQKLERFDEVLKALQTQTVQFDKCEDKLTCLYCAYATICNR